MTKELIQGLKQVNISKDSAKTSARVQEIWKSAKSADKQKVCELAGSAKATIYRIFKTGGVSAKLVVALAQVLDVAPEYFTGESDERGSCTEAQLVHFLSNLGYDKLLHEQERVVRRAQREAFRKKEAEEETAAPAAEAVPAEEKPTGKEAPSSEIVTNEDILVLLQGLEIRAKAGNPDAKELLRQIKLLLLGN